MARLRLFYEFVFDGDLLDMDYDYGKELAEDLFKEMYNGEEYLSVNFIGLIEDNEEL